MIGQEAEKYCTTVTGRVWLDQEAYVLTCQRPSGWSFQAGQYVSLTHAGEEREYTLISSPEDQAVRFLIKRLDGGRLSVALSEVEPGTSLGMSPAKGYLIYRATDRPVLFVANGVGIAPFVAMVAAGCTGFTLLHGARTLTGLHFRKELMHAAHRYIPCLTDAPAAGDDLPDLFRGRVTECAARVLPPDRYDVYLCGSRSMITAMMLLLDQHCPEVRIYSEAYT